jgi:hypothetical protein
MKIEMVAALSNFILKLSHLISWANFGVVFSE